MKRDEAKPEEPTCRRDSVSDLMFWLTMLRGDLQLRPSEEKQIEQARRKCPCEKCWEYRKAGEGLP